MENSLTSQYIGTKLQNECLLDLLDQLLLLFLFLPISCNQKHRLRAHLFMHFDLTVKIRINRLIIAGLPNLLHFFEEGNFTLFAKGQDILVWNFIGVFKYIELF